MAKRYFWLKLYTDFFNQTEIKVLRKLAGGDTYTVIYLKLLLRSLENNGKIYYEGIDDSFYSEVATMIDEDVENVKFCMMFLEKSCLMMYDTETEATFTAIDEMCGSETDSARRMRKLRNNKPKELREPSPSQCDKNVTLENKSIENKSIEYRELDSIPNLDINKNLDSNTNRENILSGKPDFVFPDWLSDKAIEEVKKGNPGNYEQRIPIAYINQKLGKNYKFVDKNIKLVKARLREGYTLDDFKTVIDKKVTEWQNNESMAKYLRPETLFGTKFDGYLNQPTAKSKGYDNDIDLPF